MAWVASKEYMWLAQNRRIAAESACKWPSRVASSPLPCSYKWIYAHLHSTVYSSFPIYFFLTGILWMLTTISAFITSVSIKCMLSFICQLLWRWVLLPMKDMNTQKCWTRTTLDAVFNKSQNKICPYGMPYALSSHSSAARNATATCNVILSKTFWLTGHHQLAEARRTLSPGLGWFRIFHHFIIIYQISGKKLLYALWNICIFHVHAHIYITQTK